MIRSMFLTAVCSALTCGIAFADDNAVEKKLAAAKSEYDKVAEKARSVLVAELKKKADTAQKAGDLATLEKVETEAKAFEDKSELPKSVPTKAYLDEMRRAKAKLEDAYKVAVSEYTKAGQRAQAKATQQELEELKQGVATVTIKAGTVWSGEHSQKFGSDPKVVKQSIKLTITEQKGNTFKGDVAIENGTNFPVEGTIELGVLTFKDTKKGHKYKGKVEGNVLTATFEGFSAALNTTTTGSWKLELTK